mmetsp:Transcript_42656/g.92041  ORF Transcript_42656/g.92041 Transcript_42656/m.92041 type:complete len:88 (+) Transcript_42656:1628-1891(+)
MIWFFVFWCSLVVCHNVSNVCGCYPKVTISKTRPLAGQSFDDHGSSLLVVGRWNALVSGCCVLLESVKVLFLEASCAAFGPVKSRSS